MNQSAGASLHVDPYSDEFQQSPFAAYAALRATAPVYQVPGHGLLRELAQRVERLEVVEPGRVRYLPSFFLRGIPSLPVRVHPRGQ